ncbi:MAG: AAA family ATPase [Anaerolineae bacterium]
MEQGINRSKVETMQPKDDLSQAALGSPRQNSIVARRNRPLPRLWRFIRRTWFWIFLITLAVSAWSNPAVLNVILIGLSFVFRLLFAVVFIVIQFGALFWFMSQTKVEIIRPGDPKSLTFEDYKGQDRLVEMVKQWLSLLYDRTEFQKMGGRFINGLLLYGPPGTGKTLLAKCMAGEAGVAFLSVEGSGFRGMFWGMDVLRMISFIRKARKLAREYGACIAFIDEIDAVGASRGGVMGGGRQVGAGMGGMMGGGTGALTRLLYEMDGVEEKTRKERWIAKWYQLRGKQPPPRNWHVLFMGSTNRPDVLDAALTRPGRFDRTIEVGRPDKTGRREIVKYYLSKIAHDESVDVEAIVQDTAWATPAKIMAAITKDAVRLALFDGRHKVSQRDIDQAFQEQAYGLEKPIEEMPEDQRRQIAYHEAGHAVALHYYRPQKRIVRATIVGRGSGVLGYVQPADKFEEYARPLRTIVSDIMVSLAGHVAVKVFLEEYWTGAYGDFTKVREHIKHLAMLGQFGPPVSDPFSMKLDIGENNPYARFWQRCEQAMEKFIRIHAAEVRAVAEALLEKESLTGEEVLTMMEQARHAAEAGDGETGYPVNGHEPQVVLPDPQEETEPADVPVDSPMEAPVLEGETVSEE